MNKTKINFKQGFTLIELLIVIAIIGILAGVVLVSTSNARIKANTAKDMLQLKSINSALQVYYAGHGNYPGPGAGCWLSSIAGSNWIPLLAAEVGALPIEHRNSSNFFTAFIYCSDGGENYKLINHAPETMGVPTSLIDPVRPTWAWGWWTPGGAGY
ncbi:MAG: hypothetical protein ACD_8C00013G0006 [uncultured bacterium]|nr:MAG: hypothetical protein ACD_8C00013G0006 [uncultured bacterium]